MAELPKIDSEGLRLAKKVSSAGVSSVVRVSKNDCQMNSGRAYLEIVEGWLRANRGIIFTEGSVDDLCKRISEWCRVNGHGNQPSADE